MEEESPFINWVIEELYKEEDLKEELAEYDTYFGALRGKDFRESEIYKRYLSKFDTLPFVCHDASGYGDVFDWDLLYRFIFASNSIEYYFKIELQNSPQLIDLHMIVKGSEEGQMVDRTLFELWLFQIFDLHYVFLSEQIRFFVGSIAEEDEQEFVFSQSMKDRIAHFQLLKDKVLIELELYELV